MEIVITQQILDSVGETIEKIFVDPRIKGLAFVQVFGGQFRIHNLELNQTLKRRFEDQDLAVRFAIARLVEVAG